MEDAVGRMNRRARLSGMRFDVDRPLRPAGVEPRIGPRRPSGDEELQRGQGQETESSERRTTIHRGLWYTIRGSLCNGRERGVGSGSWRIDTVSAVRTVTYHSPLPFPEIFP